MAMHIYPCSSIGMDSGRIRHWSFSFTQPQPILIYIKGKLFKFIFRTVMIAWFINSDVSM